MINNEEVSILSFGRKGTRFSCAVLRWKCHRITYALSFLLCVLGCLFLAEVPAIASGPATITTLTVTSGDGAVTTVASGTIVTLTATVTAGSAPVTVGRVNFCDATANYCTDIHLLGTAQLTKAGKAILKFAPGIGTHSYKAVFVGTNNYAAGTSTAAALTVTGLYPTITTIAESGSVGNYTLTSTVNGIGSTAPTGIVSFLDTSDGSSALGTAPLIADAAGVSLTNISDNIAGSWGALQIAVGDFNGDGILDAAVENCVGVETHACVKYALQVLLGNGDGTFRLASALPTEGGFSIAMGDFNGDGILDLATANLLSSTITLLLGNGDGTFTPSAASPASGIDPYAIAVGDLNGDGILDMAVVNECGSDASCNSGSTVTILLGNGDGTFTPSPVVPPTGGDTLGGAIAVGDFNGDGIPDLVVATGSNTIAVLLGNGDGTFMAAPAPPTGNGPRSIAVGDFNGDGILDMAVANYGSNTVTVLSGHGNGTFTSTAASLPTNSYPNAIAVGDFNLDGVPDLVVANGNSFTQGNTLSIFSGNGDGTFALATATTTASAANPNSIAVGDFNGDGVSDVAVGNFEGTPVAVLLTSTQSAVATATGIAAPVATTSQQVVASYAGDKSYGAGISGAISLTAAQGTPVVLLAASPNPATYGLSVTLAATVTGTGLLPTGMVYFYAGTKQFGTSMLNGSGVATIATSSLSPGQNSISAYYGGDANYLPSTSPAIVLPVYGALTPTMKVTPSSSSITTTQPLTVTVAVNGATGNPTPTGSVMLTGGGYTSAATPLSGGNANILVPAGSLATGTDILAVTYTPDLSGASIYTPASQSTSVMVTVPIGTVTSAVTATPSAATITDEQTDTVAVSVASSSDQATPTGTVTLASASFRATQTLTSGAASFTIAPGTLGNGANTLTATYSGDATYSSSSAATTITVSQVAIAVPAPSPISPGASATTNATLSAGSSYSGTMNLSCTLTGSPTGAESVPTCSLNPASVTVSSGASASSVFTAKTTAASRSALVRPSNLNIWGLGSSGTLLAGLLLVASPSRRRRRMTVFAPMWLLLVLVGAIGCGGGGGSSPVQSTPATSAGSYTFTVVGTDSSNAKITTSTSVNIIVQ